METNRKLSALIPLNHNVKIFIPSTINVNETINNADYVDKTLSTFSDLFGGATSYKAMGAWSSIDSGLVKEKVIIVEAFCSEVQLESHIDTVIIYAEKIKADMAQEAIALQIDNKMYFV